MPTLQAVDSQMYLPTACIPSMSNLLSSPWPCLTNFSYEVISLGKTSASGGTSAAAPTFAGIIGLLNDARLRAGKPVLGFLNPFLYSQGYKALNDITGGGSYGCGGIDPQSNAAVNGSLIIPGAYWNATEGWDPVTGLGTPNFQKLKDLVLAL
jgi:tripeptidyl-peptidase-1